MSDFDLERFVAAQDDGSYDAALAEVRAGHKRTHWMWFVFPQVAGLGHSEMARRYAISGIDEARAYLDHEVLGARLREIARAVADGPAASAEDLMGGVDALKLHSSLTLFQQAEPSDPVFAEALGRYWDGEPDDATLRYLEAHPAH